MQLQPLFCSGRFLLPFLTVIDRYPHLAGEVERLQKKPITRRVALEWAYELVSRWVRATRDVDLGLRAAEASRLGTLGRLDYALRTAATLRDSMALAQRYSRYYSDALELKIVREHDRVWLRLDHTPRGPRALSDFVLATYYRNHVKPHLPPDARVACCFCYPKPATTAVHEAVLDGAQLQFDAPFDGFLLEAGALDGMLDSADAALHSVHCEQVEAAHGGVSDSRMFALRVRKQIALDLEAGRPSAVRVARKLRVSRRTLVRRLAREGTSFKAQLDDLRHDLAVRLIATSPTLSLAQVARSLGFSHVQAFHRSFKRWTGTSARGYRALVDGATSAA